jgi:hypothetical protein
MVGPPIVLSADGTMRAAAGPGLRDGGEDLAIIPGSPGFLGLLHLDQIGDNPKAGLRGFPLDASPATLVEYTAQCVQRARPSSLNSQPLSRGRRPEKAGYTKSSTMAIGP